MKRIVLLGTIVAGIILILFFAAYRNDGPINVETANKKQNIRASDSVENDTISQDSTKRKINIHVEKRIDGDMAMNARALLDNGEFDEVIAIYESSTGKQRSAYESELVEYLTILAVQNPTLAKSQILSFLAVNPSSVVLDALIEIYVSENQYEKIVKILQEFRENYTNESQGSVVLQKIHQNAKKEIMYLKKSENYQSLVEFLEEMINYDDRSRFYSLELARVYAQSDRVNDSLDIIESLESDEISNPGISKLKEEIMKELEGDKYKFELALQKNGEHYFLDVELDGRVYKLLLDTGASLIMIDSDKSTDFEIINDNVMMQTAGDPVEAKLCKADLLQVGDIELRSVKFISAPFDRENMDGLLGMNFFKQFDFHIDQKKNILYLNPK